MTRVTGASAFAKADAEEAVLAGIDASEDHSIPDEVWQSYLNGTAGRVLREKRIHEKNIQE